MCKRIHLCIILTYLRALGSHGRPGSSELQSGTENTLHGSPCPSTENLLRLRRGGKKVSVGCIHGIGFIVFFTVHLTVFSITSTSEPLECFTAWPFSRHLAAHQYESSGQCGRLKVQRQMSYGAGKESRHASGNPRRILASPDHS